MLLYFEGKCSFHFTVVFKVHTHDEGETPDTNCIAKVNILGHIVAQGKRKKSLSFGHCVQGGEVKPESKSFEVVFFSPVLTLFWTINGGRGKGS